MRARAFSVAFACALVPCSGLAQPYPALTPVPRTTDAGRLRALAGDREVVERIRLGVAALDRRDWDAAASDLERAVALHAREPQGSTALYDLGLARAGQGKLDDAAAAFAAAIALDPGFLAARANLVGVHLLRGDVSAARAAADAFVDHAPDSARARYARGVVALRGGDARTALADFGKLLARDPSYAVARYDLAVAQAQSGALAEAERSLRDVLALAPAYARARVALGAVLLRENKRDEARAAFDEAANASQDLALRSLAASLRDAIAR